MPGDEMVEKVARDAAKKMFFGLDPIDCHDDSDTYLVTFETAVKHIAVALAAAEAETKPVASNTRPAFGQGSYIADALTKNIPPCACQLGSASPPIRDEPVEDERRHCNHCAARFLTVWERCQHEREAHTRPPSEAAIRADERAAIRKGAFEEAAAIAKIEAEQCASLGCSHPENSQNRDRLFARARSAEAIATAIRARGER